MNRIGNKKAIGGAYLMVVIVVALGLVVLSSTLGWFLWSMKESVDIYNRYTIAGMDAEIQSLKQVFEKTAAFHSIMDTFSELTTHGNYPQDTLTDTDLDGYVDNTNPKLRVETQSTPIPYWAHPGCMKMDMRLPYLTSAEPNVLAGDAEYCAISNDEGQFDQYMTEAALGTYDFHMVIQIFMLKKGQLEITGGPGFSLLRAVETPPTITTDGIYEYTITNINSGNLLANPTCPLSIEFQGTNPDGETDEVALIKYISLTIYDNKIIHAQDDLFTENLNRYHTTLNTQLVKRNADPENQIALSVSPLRGTYIPGEFIKGMVWPTGDGITATVKDELGMSDDDIAIIKDSGLIEEEVKLRYHAISTAGEYLLLNLDTIIKDRIYAELNNLEDYLKVSYTNGCTAGPSCPDDATTQYTESDFTDLIQAALDEAKDDLDNQYSSQSIEWEFIGPSTIRMDCAGDHTNHQRSSGSGHDICTGGDNVDTGYDAYLIYHDYIENSCSKSICRNDCKTFYTVTCTMIYGHSYALKHIKILVKITDTKYKYYDVGTNQWTDPALQFYILIDKVEDNECSATPCSSIITTDSDC